MYNLLVVRMSKSAQVEEESDRRGLTCLRRKHPLGLFDGYLHHTPARDLRKIGHIEGKEKGGRTVLAGPGACRLALGVMMN